MNETIVVFDLETSLDRSAFARAHKLVEHDHKAYEEVLGESFPKPPFHQIEAIGVLRARLSAEGWKAEALGAPHRGARSERELIAGFVRSLEDTKPKLVTFNGGSFDLPVLRWRAMLHEVPAPALSNRKYFARYLDDAVDLCDVLASFDGRSKVSLDHACQALGIGGKPLDVDGSQVQKLVDEGRYAEIAAYCERDVVLTYLLWLRFELFSGRLTEICYRASLNHFGQYLGAMSTTKPHLQDLVAVAAHPANEGLADLS
jgi:3'-5' exonuclease